MQSIILDLDFYSGSRALIPKSFLIKPNLQWYLSWQYCYSLWFFIKTSGFIWPILLWDIKKLHLDELVPLFLHTFTFQWTRILSPIYTRLIVKGSGLVSLSLFFLFLFFLLCLTIPALDHLLSRTNAGSKSWWYLFSLCLFSAFFSLLPFCVWASCGSYSLLKFLVFFHRAISLLGKEF